MNLKKRLRHIASLSDGFRGIGRTTYNAKLAKENGGVVIAATFDQAKYIERTHGVATKSMEMNLEGYSGPFFVDHNAMDILLRKAADKIEKLEKDRATLIDLIKMELGGIKAEHLLEVKRIK